jgi:ADP-ribose pyrophosphatase
MFLYQGKHVALVKEENWEFATRLNATGAAVIVAVTENQKLLLVEQYRIPVQSRTIELPAGIIGDGPGDSDEDPKEASRRELLEETGYSADEIAILTTGPSSSGITSELVTLVRATRLRRLHSGGGVAHENITVHEVALSEVDGWLDAKAKAGFLIDPKIYAGLYFLTKTGRSQ